LNVIVWMAVPLVSCVLPTPVSALMFQA